MDHLLTNMQFSTTLQEMVKELREFKVLKWVKICMLTWRVFAVPVTYYDCEIGMYVRMYIRT